MERKIEDATAQDYRDAIDEVAGMFRDNLDVQLVATCINLSVARMTLKRSLERRSTDDPSE